MSFDPTKPARTRSGLPVRILATDLRGRDASRPILAAIDVGDEEVIVYRYPDGSLSGSGGVPNDADLVNVPERIERYANVYRSARHSGPSVGMFYKTEADADRRVGGSSRHIGVIKLTSEGDVLKRVELV
ncbi:MULTISPECIES: hypothetical protein [unclassified Sphingomonas]|uniref:hypothetical protein n=1 Tax=unclassified Sphingomonas TaxID=196159 RepID=UPI0021514CFE|nr:MULTISPECIES: hypothetical protein [unclassified Sphingomonas]MCR5870702.1 hypothetical protein [Sphingomonas sp. J344]UUY00962.1 hypothetical protein LRS08_07875 [Sphingomonas sp. J315]